MVDKINVGLNQVNVGLNKVREITSSMERLENIIDKLANTIETLIIRIDVVLSPATPSNPPVNKEQPLKAPLTMELDNKADRIDDIISLLNDVIQRVEL
jgi:Asp-tRNA(Asn)/Glu-tRNA(Gln) amidotransferase A subunit family amidase